MTTLIQQRTGNDCALASIAMAYGCQSWHDIWTEADLAKVVKDQGVGDIEPWLKRVGWQRRTHWRTVNIYGRELSNVHGLLWGRRALLSIHSLNIDGGNHLVYWDGEHVWDPSTQRTHAHLHSCIVTTAHVLAATLPMYQPPPAS